LTFFREKAINGYLSTPFRKSRKTMTFLAKKTAKSTPILPVSADSFAAWLKKQDAQTQNWVAASGFTGATGKILSIPAADGSIAKVLFGVGKDDSLYTYAALPNMLPKNDAGYYIDKKMSGERATQVALGWALGTYQFAAYKPSNKKDTAALIWPEKADKASVQATAEAVFLVRDLVNTPANDLGPAEIENAGGNLISSFNNASIKVITGEDLLKQNYPAIYEVGKASPREPRLIDIRWGNEKHPMVTLIGKGVVFDTGGLDIKPSSGMLLMKKDMGGAAHVLGLAHMIMSAKLPIRLRVLIPAVENSISGNAFRPGDIIKTRKGLSVEIGNTDAEGRLILCDALAEACREKPDMIIDFATLTGAARVALGPELPAMFSNNDKLANDLLEASKRSEDPMWRLPLWEPYLDMMNSKIADINNAGAGGMAGSITAALYLQKFVDADTPWVHIDTYAWNNGSRPGRPDGGEALGMRAAYSLLQKKYGKRKP
jgi:leucyl aminopeptidase